MTRYVIVYRECLAGGLKIRKFQHLIRLTDYLQENPEYVVVSIAKEL